MKYSLFFILFYSYSNFSFAQWANMQGGVNGPVNAFYVDSTIDRLFVGGQFDNVGGNNLNNIATWDGNNWNQFGNNQRFSSPGLITTIVRFNGNIIVGGLFDSIGNTLVNNIALWNGSNWESVGGGFDGEVSDLIVYKSELFATGSFANSGINFSPCFAKWDGVNWSRVSNLIGYGNSFTIYGGKLILTGSFFHQSINTFRNILGWDGSNLDSTLGIFNNEILYAKNIYDTLYVTGSFTSNASIPANYIALYYNQSWHSIGQPTGGLNWITSVEEYKSKIYLSGYFTNPPDLCSYNGVNFDSVAEVDGYFKVLQTFKNKLYAAGSFTRLNGDVNFRSIAEFNNQVNLTSNNDNLSDINIFPNPSTGRNINISFNSLNIGSINFEIYSTDGAVIYSKYFNGNLTSTISIDLPEYSGLALIKINIDYNKLLIKKLLIISLK
jgi:hypothetical protein